MTATTAATTAICVPLEARGASPMKRHSGTSSAHSNATAAVARRSDAVRVGLARIARFAFRADVTVLETGAVDAILRRHAIGVDVAEIADSTCRALLGRLEAGSTHAVAGRAIRRFEARRAVLTVAANGLPLLAHAEPALAIRLVITRGSDRLIGAPARVCLLYTSPS